MSSKAGSVNDTDIINDKELFRDYIQRVSTCFETEMDDRAKRLTGSYYTSLELTRAMMKEMFDTFSPEFISELSRKKFLEPCVGTGNFVFAYLEQVSSLNFSREEIKDILENIYVCDINGDALDVYKSLLKSFSKLYFNIVLDDEYFSKHIGNGLLFDVNCDKPRYIPISNVFPPEVIEGGFDIVVTNPPYKNLKAELRQYSSVHEYDIEKNRYSAIASISYKMFEYSTDGVLNLYKLFVEEILERYSAYGGFISLLIPSTILSDKTCEKLRTRILENHRLHSVKVIKENNPFTNARQSLCAVLIEKNRKGKNILMTKDYCENPNQVTSISLKDVLNKNTGNSIFALNDYEYKMLKQLRKFPVVSDCEFIVNMRGELDLTSNKASYSENKTEYPMLRGRNIGYYEFSDVKINEFVSDDFVNNSAKRSYILQNRIVCQQISNINKKRRVTFAFVPAGYVLGNSCNFITVLPNTYSVDLYFILGLFNSTIINWYFKLTSSNNHINNYEIDTFPIPLLSPYNGEISRLVKEYLDKKDSNLLSEIDRYVNLAYRIFDDSGDIEYIPDTKPITKKQATYQTTLENISISEVRSSEIMNTGERFMNDVKYLLNDITAPDIKNILRGSLDIDSAIISSKSELSDFDKTVCKKISEKYIKLSKDIVLNHNSFKLSALDKEMIRSVPQGGNWSNIPAETVCKSKRLIQITKSGGRTTLYGRIDYNKPSFTITTYFNRPGNGTYVHPIHDRVISVREASRFQSFKDDYYFYGNKSQILKQVGNAVPPLLAYQIGKKIIEICNCKTSVDLFCGCGGLTAGFKEAGIVSVLGNDIEESACITLKVNNPDINVLCGDVTTDKIKNIIVDTAIEHRADIICGGPPCQGFSMAGFRLLDDPRNKLFKEFVDIVSRVKPKVTVFENVVGLLSFQNGEVYREILNLFSRLGYNTEGRVLNTAEYAIPQRRKRVIVICVRKDLNISPSLLFPDKITKDEKKRVTAYEAISDLERVECLDDSKYVYANESEYVYAMKNKISFEEFLKSMRFKK